MYAITTRDSDHIMKRRNAFVQARHGGGKLTVRVNHRVDFWPICQNIAMKAPFASGFNIRLRFVLLKTTVKSHLHHALWRHVFHSHAAWRDKKTTFKTHAAIACRAFIKAEFNQFLYGF